MAYPPLARKLVSSKSKVAGTADGSFNKVFAQLGCGSLSSMTTTEFPRNGLHWKKKRKEKKKKRNLATLRRLSAEQREDGFF